MKIKSAQATLNALEKGQVMNDMAKSIHDAMAAVKEHMKPATITLTLTIRPLGTKGVSDAVEFIGEVSEKLPKPAPPGTLFFFDDDGNPSQQRSTEKEPELGLKIAPSAPPQHAG